jgi:hypothetical protein
LSKTNCRLCAEGRIHLREQCEDDKAGRWFRQWRRDFLRDHVAGANEDHRLAGKIADQADELDRLRADLAAAQARSAQIEAAARDVVAEWSKPASRVDMAKVGSRLDDLVRVLGEGT